MEVMRRNAAFRRLPIIALAAQAMKGDRERRASVSDALAKPVIAEQLLSDLRIWCTVRRA
jgi:CheY-like chemotaxis protein